jgi:hypothetical protein
VGGSEPPEPRPNWGGTGWDAAWDGRGTALSYVPLVRSFVLRLLDDQLRDGRVVGRVQDVESGSEAVVRDVEELLTFLTAEPAAEVDLTVHDRADDSVPLEPPSS